MSIEQGTFPMINPGVDNNPDFYSGPDAIAPTEKGFIKGIISQNPPNTTVKFRRAPRSTEELNEIHIKSAAIDQALTDLTDAITALNNGNPGTWNDTARLIVKKLCVHQKKMIQLLRKELIT